MIDIFGMLDNIKTVAKKEVIVTELPSQGMFYPIDMKLYVHKISKDDITAIKNTSSDNFNTPDLLKIVKGIVKKYTSFNDGYDSDDICFIDVMYIFWEIIMHTKNVKLYIDYNNGGENITIPFDSTTFNYFDFSPYMKYYDGVNRIFNFDGRKFTFFKIGIEESIKEYIEYKTLQLLTEDRDEELEALQHSNCYFINFCYKYKRLTHEQIENLMCIFNEDMEQEDKESVEKIIEYFAGRDRYTLKDNDILVEVSNQRMVEYMFKYGL